MSRIIRGANAIRPISTMDGKLVGVTGDVELDETPKTDGDIVEDDEEKCDAFVIRERMDEKKDPSVEDIELMEDFLCTCVSESRLDDVVSILRLIKMRSDVWGMIHYQSLLGKAEQLIKTYEGRCFDKEWFGL